MDAWYVPNLYCTWRRITNTNILTSFDYVGQLQVGKQAILAILLASFAGFGIMMSGSSIVAELFRWRRNWQASPEQRNGSQVMTQEGLYSQGVIISHSSLPNHSQTAALQNHQNSNHSWIEVCWMTSFILFVNCDFIGD